MNLIYNSISNLYISTLFVVCFDVSVSVSVRVCVIYLVVVFAAAAVIVLRHSVLNVFTLSVILFVFVSSASLKAKRRKQNSF